MRRADREVTEFKSILGIIDSAEVLRLALLDDDCPYIVPLHFGYEAVGDQITFYMHSVKEGKKLDLIRRSNAACIELEGPTSLVSGGDVPCRYGAAFSSVVARGRARVIDDASEKAHGLKLLMRHQTGRDFAIDEQMADTVEVIAFTAQSVTAKARLLG